VPENKSELTFAFPYSKNREKKAEFVKKYYFCAQNKEVH